MATATPVKSTSGVIIGAYYTPYDQNNTRLQVHPETQIDAVTDPVTGVPLRERLDNLDDLTQPADAALKRPGLITPEMINKYDNMLANGIVIGSVKPSSGSSTIWQNVYDASTTIEEAI